MRRSLVTVAAVAAAAAASFCDPDPQWATVWLEEFEGDSLNASAWNVVVGTSDVGSCRDAYCSPNNVHVTGGNLVLTSKLESMGGANYTTGAVNTRNLEYWNGTYRICVSAILPGYAAGQPHAGAGVWPAAWCMPNDDSCWPTHGEQDILEMINGDGYAHGTYHWQVNASCGLPNHPSVTAELQMADDWGTAYHEYALERSPTHLAYVYDGVTILNVTGGSGAPGSKDPILTATPFYLILNTAIGGPWPGPANSSTVFPTNYTIDYVRVSQPV